MSRRSAWICGLTLLPTLLLAVVAANQLRLASTEGLSAWKGGGFGMFSTTDGGPNRSLRIIATSDGRDAELTLPHHLEDLAQRAEELPTRDWLQRLACSVELHAEESGRPIEALQFEIWRTRYDPSDLRPSLERLALHRHSAGACDG